MPRIVFSAVAALLIAGCSRDPVAATRRYIESGDRYAAQGKYGEAAIEYRNAIKRTPQSVEAHSKLAAAAAGAHDAETAVGETLRLAELQPDDVAAQVRAGSIYLLAGRFADAKKSAEAALRLDGTDASAHILLGQALAALHDAQKSESSFREAVRVAPQSVDAHVALGSYLWASNQTAGAETELRRGVELGPKQAGANRALALFYMAAGRPDDAEPLWTVVSQSGDGDPFALADFHASQGRLRDAERELRPLVETPRLADAARLRLAGVLYSLGNRTSAHQALDAVLAHDPRNLAALLVRARFLVAERRLDEALKIVEAARASDPASADAAFFEGQIHAAKQNPERAIQSFQAALKLNPAAAPAAAAIAELRLGDGHPQDAIEWATRATNAQPSDPVSRLLLVRALAAGGRLARAEQVAREAVALWPNATALRSALALVEAQRAAAEGAPDKAEQQLKHLIAADPANLQAYTMLGQLYLKQGRLEAARQEFGRIAARTPTAVGARTMVGMILQGQGRKADARKAYEEILGLDPHAAVAANNLAWMYLEDDRLDEALRLALVAREKLRRTPEVNDTLGWIYVRRNQPNDAIGPLTEAVEARPENVLYREHLQTARENARR
jgi:tetratricopeptide (TPR) repeat protein